jgi:KaiC/GvpD/RAD55 family RecA-like ATPase
MDRDAKPPNVTPPQTDGEFDDWDWEPPDEPQDQLEMRVSQSMNLAPRPRFILPGLLPRQSVGLVVSEPCVGKTFLLVDLAIALAMEQPFLGVQPTQAFTSLCLFLDSSGWAMRYLVEAIFAGRQANWETLNQRILYKARSTERFDFNRKEDVMKLIETARHYGAGVIGIDCFSKVNSAEENSRNEMEVIMDRIALVAHETQAAVLVLDHAPVAGRDKKSVYQARGSSVKEADADLIWHLRNGRDGTKELEVRKARGMASEGTIYTYRIQKVECVGVRDPAKIEVLSVGKAGEMASRQSRMEAVIRNVMTTGGEVEVPQLKAAALDLKLAPVEKVDMAVRNALTRMKARGEVRRVRRNVWCLVSEADNDVEVEDGAAGE